MTDPKINESILIAEELAKEICTGKPSTAALAQQWKEESPALYEEIRRQEQLSEEISFHDSINVDESLQQINKRIIAPSRRFSIRTLGIAASFLLIVGSASLWLWTANHEEAVAEWASSIPGESRSSIIAQDGKAVELTENNLTVKGNQLIGSTLDGKRNISIELQPDNQFNKLAVPAGGEYRLTLEDGTVVQVNAASELLFPTHFKKHMRQVKLRGEACFKVESDKNSPFYVQLDVLNVQVTGTTFNIKAYEEEEEINIALIEGSVNIREGQRLLATLAPGQLFTYRKADRQYDISEANLSAVTGWTEGKFIFYNETIGHIMQEVSRWYDVDITVGKEIRNMRYSGILSRKQPLTEMLNALRLTNELDFKIYKDKRIDALEKEN